MQRHIPDVPVAAAQQEDSIPDAGGRPESPPLPDTHEAQDAEGQVGHGYFELEGARLPADLQGDFLGL